MENGLSYMQSWATLQIQAEQWSRIALGPEKQKFTFAQVHAQIIDSNEPNQTIFGSNCLMSLALKIWSGLPNEIQLAENLKNLKLLIRQ